MKREELALLYTEWSRNEIVKRLELAEGSSPLIFFVPALLNKSSVYPDNGVLRCNRGMDRSIHDTIGAMIPPKAMIVAVAKRYHTFASYDTIRFRSVFTWKAKRIPAIIGTPPWTSSFPSGVVSLLACPT